ncbi:Uncharacterised protein [Catenibacterium mitsuokai]|nr:Uncharacterised protein [Catenibacterium mitsuokai]
MILFKEFFNAFNDLIREFILNKTVIVVNDIVCTCFIESRDNMTILLTKRNLHLITIMIRVHIHQTVIYFQILMSNLQECFFYSICLKRLLFMI